MKGVWPWRSPNAPIQPTKSWDVNPKDDINSSKSKKSNKILWNFEKNPWDHEFQGRLRFKIIFRNKKSLRRFFAERQCFCCTDFLLLWSRDRFLALKMGETICHVEMFSKIETNINFQNDLTHQLMLFLLPKHVNSWCVSRLILQSMYINVLRFEFTFSNLRFLRGVTLDFPKKFQQKRIKPTIKVEKSHGNFQLMNFLQKLDFYTTELSFRTQAQWSNLHLLQPILLYLPPPWCKENGQTYIWLYIYIIYALYDIRNIHINMISLQEMNRKKGHMMKSYYVGWLNKVI